MKSPFASPLSPPISTPGSTQATVSGCGPRPRRRHREAGSAALVVFIVLSLMVGFLLANARALHHLKQEIRLVEQRQLKKFHAPDFRSTNNSARPAVNHSSTNTAHGQNQSP